MFRDDNYIHNRNKCLTGMIEAKSFEAPMEPTVRLMLGHKLLDDQEKYQSLVVN